MEKYDYDTALTEDILHYIIDNNVLSYEYSDKDELFNILADECWAEDSITGNGPYGYASEEKCEYYLYKNIDLLIDAARNFNITLEDIAQQAYKGHLARYCDALIRTYLFYSCLDKALSIFKINKGDNQ